MAERATRLRSAPGVHGSLPRPENGIGKQAARAASRGGMPAAAALLLTGLLALSAPASASDAGTQPPTRVGASAELRTRLIDEPSIWQTLQAQFDTDWPEGPMPSLPSAMPPTARLTLREAIATALANNPRMLAASLQPESVAQNVLKAQAFFDPIFGSDANYGRTNTPVTNIFQGSGQSDSDDEFIAEALTSNWDFFLDKGLLSGGRMRLAWTNEKLSSDSFIQALNPMYTPQLVATLNQPLLRDFGLRFTRLRIAIAEAATEGAVAQFQAQAANFVTLVIAAYWQVVATAERVEVLQASLDLAEKTVRENRTRVEVGVLPPVAIKESEAEAARRREDVLVAENDLATARRQLQQIVYLPGENEFVPRPIDAIERPSSERVEFDVEEAVRTAVVKRPEIRAARESVRQSKLQVDLDQNQLLPRVDLYGAGGVNAASGTATQVEIGGVVYPPSPYDGPYSKALDRMFSGDFYTYQAGLRLEIPIANAGAEAQARQSRISREQASAGFRQEVSDVVLQVTQSAGDLSSAMERVEATRVSRELAEENLRNQTRRYEVGMVTPTDLIKFQNDVAQARLAEVQTIIHYNNSLAAFERARGTILTRYNVEIETREPTHVPWWARF